MVEQAAPPRSPNYGGRAGHAVFHWCIRWLGVRPAYTLLGLIVAYYVVFRPSARRSTAAYLKHRFPGRSRLRLLLTTFRYLYTFGRVLIDQAALGVLGPDAFTVDLPGSEHLRRLVTSRCGLILLTTHVGSWQASMVGMSGVDVPVHFQLHLERHTAGRHFFDLAGNRGRFRIIPPQGFLGGMIEMTNALEAGECVAVMGDRAWGGRTKRASFLGEQADFPITPYHLAVLTNAHLVVVLTIRTGKCAYRIEHVRITENGECDSMSRDDAIDMLLRRYVKCLEDHLADYPLMWFNLFDFWRGGNEDAR